MIYMTKNGKSSDSLGNPFAGNDSYLLSVRKTNPQTISETWQFWQFQLPPSSPWLAETLHDHERQILRQSRKLLRWQWQLPPPYPWLAETSAWPRTANPQTISETPSLAMTVTSPLPLAGRDFCMTRLSSCWSFSLNCRRTTGRPDGRRFASEVPPPLALLLPTSAPRRLSRCWASNVDKVWSLSEVGWLRATGRGLSFLAWLAQRRQRASWRWATSGSRLKHGHNWKEMSLSLYSWADGWWD